MACLLSCLTVSKSPCEKLISKGSLSPGGSASLPPQSGSRDGLPALNTKILFPSECPLGGPGSLAPQSGPRVWGAGGRRLGTSLPAAVALPGMGLWAQRDQVPALQEFTSLWAGQVEFRVLSRLCEKCQGVLHRAGGSQVAA